MTGGGGGGGGAHLTLPSPLGKVREHYYLKCIFLREITSHVHVWLC